MRAQSPTDPAVAAFMRRRVSLSVIIAADVTGRA
jgi:hypothetical protein